MANGSLIKVPEGLCLPWSDSLCKRALDEGPLFADDVEQLLRANAQLEAFASTDTLTGLPNRRALQATRGRFGRADFSLDYAGASVGSIAVRPGTLTASEALHEADHAMYVTKQARKRSAQG